MRDFLETLNPPRVIFLYVPAGTAIDSILDGLASQLQYGNVIADGGNSYWGGLYQKISKTS